MITAARAAKLSKEELQKELKILGLAVEGDKEVLVQRLVEAIEKAAKDLEEKKKQRSLRFGIPLVETKSTSSKTEKPSKTVNSASVPQPKPVAKTASKQIKPTTLKVQLDPQLAAKRQQKFSGSPTTELKPKSIHD
jgi:hypothetical protein